MATLLDTLNDVFVLTQFFLKDVKAFRDLPILSLDTPLERLFNNLHDCAMWLIAQYILRCGIILSPRWHWVSTDMLAIWVDILDLLTWLQGAQRIYICVQLLKFPINLWSIVLDKFLEQFDTLNNDIFEYSLPLLDLNKYILVLV